MVMSMRRVVSVLAVFGLFVAALAFGSSAATAAAATCGSGYPVTTQASIASSTTTPFVGESIKVSGTCYHANEDVAITIGGVSVGTAHTDANGSFELTVTVPNLLGGQLLVGRGASGATNDVDSLTLTIEASGAAGVSGGGGGGLASTGVKIAGLVLLAGALIGGGAFFAIAGRRRRSAVPS
ncbi:MAG: hypothetical protein QOG22_1811 [Pseudonocardiales bacterium]|jgi:hypothetical protein|nr:hypothetical protein [Pseudonocardiales bacterium]